MPLPIQVGSVTQALQRAFGFKGRYTPLLDEVIVPVYVIADPSPASRTKLCAATMDVTNGNDANSAGMVQLFNPPGSGNIVNVTNVVARGDQKFGIRVIFFDGGDGFAPGPDIHFRDRRNLGLPSSIIRREDDNAGVGLLGSLVARIDVDGTLTQASAWAAAQADPRQPLAVLPEGRGLALQFAVPGLLNELMSANFQFLEIPASEVRPPGGLP